MSEAPPVGLYVHWPYCARICPYCDFNVVRARGREEEGAALIDAILADIEAQAAHISDRRLVSIFFGGGTPSLLSPKAVASLIARAKGRWSAAGDLEVTLEANPTDAETERFAGFAAAGVNRLSLGVQSLDDGELAFLGRNHGAGAARRALNEAARNFPRVSADLIYALPGQSPEAWSAALSEIADFGLEHISPYQLTIELGTAFDRAVRRRLFAPPQEDLAAELYEVTQSTLQGLGFEAYEVSNHARAAAARSRHNLLYWRGEDYVGVGPGAHGRWTLADGRYATETPKSIGGYIGRVKTGGMSAEPVKLEPRERALERLLMGLRTVEGVARRDLEPLAIVPERILKLDGLVRMDGERLVATSSGRPVLDRIVAELADAV